MPFDLKEELGLNITDSGNVVDSFEPLEDVVVEETPTIEEAQDNKVESEDETKSEESVSGSEVVDAPANLSDSSDQVDPPSDISPEQAEISRLRQLLEEANAKFVEKQAPAQKSSENNPPTTIQARDFLPEGVDVEDVLTDKGKLNQLLNVVHQAAVAEATQRFVLSVPEIVAAQVQQQTALRQSVESFYTKHPHLSGFKRTVAAAATEISAANPDWSVDQVFDAAAAKATELIGWQQQVSASAPTASVGQPLKTPALNAPKGGRGGKSSAMTKMQREIEDLISGV